MSESRKGALPEEPLVATGSGPLPGKPAGSPLKTGLLIACPVFILALLALVIYAWLGSLIVAVREEWDFGDKPCEWLAEKLPFWTIAPFIRRNGYWIAERNEEAWAACLIQALRHPNPGTRLQASYSFYPERTKPSASILKALQDNLADPDLEARRATVYAIVQICENGPADLRPVAVRILIGAMSNSDPEVRFRSADCLGDVDPDEGQAAIQALIEALRDSDVFVCSSAACALGKIAPDDPEIVIPLAELLAHEDIYPRVKVLEALNRIGIEAVDALPALITVVDGDEYYDARLDALRVIGWLGPLAADAVPVLVNVLEKKYIRADGDYLFSSGTHWVCFDVYTELERWATWALGRIGRAAAEAEAIFIANMQQEELAWTTAIALANMELRSENDFETLWRFYTASFQEKVPRSGLRIEFLDETPSERYAGLYALGRLFPERTEVREALLQTLECKEPWARLAAALNLKRAGYNAEEADLVLQNELTAGDPYEYLEIFCWTLNDTSALPWFEEVLKHEPDERRRSAIRFYKKKLSDLKQAEEQAVSLPHP